MRAQSFQTALYRIGWQVPIRSDLGGQLREILLLQFRQLLCCQCSIQQNTILGIFRLWRTGTNIHIQFVLTPVPDGRVNPAGAATIGQFLLLDIPY